MIDKSSNAVKSQLKILESIKVAIRVYFEERIENGLYISADDMSLNNVENYLIEHVYNLMPDINKVEKLDYARVCFKKYLDSCEAHFSQYIIALQRDVSNKEG